jgi:hypothetical protein
MHKLRLYVLGISVVAGCLAVFLLFAPVPDFIINAQQFRQQLTAVTSFSIFYFAAAILFLYGMHEFKPEMRRSYLIITMSMAFFGFINLQYPLLLYAGEIPGPWLWYGGSMLIIVPGVIMHYWGVRHMAKTLGLSSRSMSVPLLFATTLVLSGLTVLLPHVHEIAEPWFIVHQAAAVLNLSLNLFSILIALAILKIVGASYRVAFRWLALSVGISTLGFVHIIIAALFGQNNPYGDSGATAVPFIAVSIAYAISGYYFCKVRLFGQSDAQAIIPGRGMLDAVISTASLISDPKEIDILLDDVRNLTAQMQADAPLTAADAARLAHIYLELEEYLLNREKLKTFTQAGLRARLNPEALQLVTANTSA